MHSLRSQKEESQKEEEEALAFGVTSGVLSNLHHTSFHSQLLYQYEPFPIAMPKDRRTARMSTGGRAPGWPKYGRRPSPYTTTPETQSSAPLAAPAATPSPSAAAVTTAGPQQSGSTEVPRPLESQQQGAQLQDSRPLPEPNQAKTQLVEVNMEAREPSQPPQGAQVSAERETLPKS